MLSTFAPSGRLARYTTALLTFETSMTGSTSVEPFACGTPLAITPPMLVSALPISIWLHAMLYLRPSSEVLRVMPSTACFVAVYGAESGGRVVSIRNVVQCCKGLTRSGHVGRHAAVVDDPTAA